MLNTTVARAGVPRVTEPFAIEPLTDCALAAKQHKRITAHAKITVLKKFVIISGYFSSKLASMASALRKSSVSDSARTSISNRKTRPSFSAIL
jgi:hypothetical protein